MLLKKLEKFLVDFIHDERFPKEDKRLLAIFLILSLITVFFTSSHPEGSFIAFLFIFSFIPDYFFNILDQNQLLSIYPFDYKSYSALKKIGSFLAMICPRFMTSFIWKYEKDIY